MRHIRSFLKRLRLDMTLQKGLTILCMSSLMLLGCSAKLDNQSALRQYEAFAYMQVETNVIVAYGCTSDNDKVSDSCAFIASQPHKSNASGVVVMNSKTVKGRQYVLTAAHVCESAVNHETRLKQLLMRQSSFVVDRFMYSSSMKIKNSTGKTYDGKVVALWRERDLCMVAVEGMKIIPVQVAEKQIKKGDKMWNLAAPLGIWQPDLQNKFEGYYAGVYTCEEDTKDTFPIECTIGEPTWSVFDIPATHGSSGSPLFNNVGELIGIISMVPGSFPEIAYASRLEDIQYIINKTKEWDKQAIDVDYLSDDINHSSLIEL